MQDILRCPVGVKLNDFIAFASMFSLNMMFLHIRVNDRKPISLSIIVMSYETTCWLMDLVHRSMPR